MAAKLTLAVYGLDADNKLVRATVFAQKLNAFLGGLRLADKFANGNYRHELIIEEMSIGSARVQIREKQRTTERPLRSAVETYEDAAKAIYGAQPSVAKYPPRLVKTFGTLSRGTAKQFMHAEIEFSGSNVIRIDDFLLRQSEKALATLSERIPSNMNKTRYFRGTAVSTFDGMLRVIDSRGELLRATLITTAGDREIDCIVNKNRVHEFAENFDCRVRIEGTAHYEGDSPLPVRVDVNAIRTVKRDADLRRWRGAFTGSAALKEDWDI